MKTVIQILVLVALGAASLIITNKVNSLQLKISELEQSISNLRDSARSDNNSLQDSLEERIGTLERDVDGLKFILGEKPNAH